MERHFLSHFRIGHRRPQRELLPEFAEMTPPQDPLSMTTFGIEARFGPIVAGNTGTVFLFDYRTDTGGHLLNFRGGKEDIPLSLDESRSVMGRFLARNNSQPQYFKLSSEKINHEETTIKEKLFPSINRPYIFIKNEHIIDGNITYIEWWARRTTPEDVKLFEDVPKPTQKMSSEKNDWSTLSLLETY